MEGSVCVVPQSVCEGGGLIIYLCSETESGSLEPRCRRPPLPQRKGGAVN